MTAPTIVSVLIELPKAITADIANKLRNLAINMYLYDARVEILNEVDRRYRLDPDKYTGDKYQALEDAVTAEFAQRKANEDDQ